MEQGERRSDIGDGLEELERMTSDKKMGCKGLPCISGRVDC